MLWATSLDVELRGFLLLGFGIVVGGIIKKKGFLNKIGDNWSFTEKVTDWTIVSELASEQGEVANSDFAPVVPPPAPSE